MRRALALFSPYLLSQKFWAPFSQGVTGHDVTKYKISAAIQEIVPTREEGFSCTVNGVSGNLPLHIEDFFVALTTGFDLSPVAYTQSPQSTMCTEISCGELHLCHARSFLGWKPTHQHVVIQVPFELQLIKNEESDAMASRVVLSANVGPPLRSAGCPEDVLCCLTSVDALRMLVALRRAKVKPEYISHRALMSATKKEESWCSALHLL